MAGPVLCRETWAVAPWLLKGLNREPQDFYHHAEIFKKKSTGGSFNSLYLHGDHVDVIFMDANSAVFSMGHGLQVVSWKV